MTPSPPSRQGSPLKGKGWVSTVTVTKDDNMPDKYLKSEDKFNRNPQIKPDALRSKSTEELKRELEHLQIVYQRLQNGISTAEPGYRKTHKLYKGNPHPRTMRIAIARVLTILRERGAN